jgi:hypothetical protein
VVESGDGRRTAEGDIVAEKLNMMDTFPSVTLNLAGGGTLTVPDEIGTDYTIVLFYRGHW